MIANTVRYARGADICNSRLSNEYDYFGGGEFQNGQEILCLTPQTLVPGTPFGSSPPNGLGMGLTTRR
jgi:hypothetical protein